MIRVHDSSFLGSATEAASYPNHGGLEVAFAGRSNVGKSSLINAITGRRKLVKVSRTPGRTRLLNFFSVTVAEGQKKHKVCLCDLPGYGYAKVSKSERHSWQPMIERYLTDRNELRAIVLIVDAEVGVTPHDLQMREWLTGLGRQVVVIATKIDRLPKAKRIPAMRAVERDLEVPAGSILPFSSVDSVGVEELWAMLLAIPAASAAAV